jgi:hypothetical protein
MQGLGHRPLGGTLAGGGEHVEPLFEFYHKIQEDSGPTSLNLHPHRQEYVHLQVCSTPLYLSAQFFSCFFDEDYCFLFLVPKVLL